MSKQKVNKSQAIREEFAAHGWQLASREVIDRLAARGITVSFAEVANVRRRQNQAKAAVTSNQSQPPQRTAKEETRRVAGSTVMLTTIDALMDAKEVVDRVGSIGAVLRALDVLARLKS